MDIARRMDFLQTSVFTDLRAEKEEFEKNTRTRVLDFTDVLQFLKKSDLIGDLHLNYKNL
ncbi:hypothetical protein [Allobaculum sp. JKK-2023]|uniref:hypothetical protein n=1 Tax=Allobaculum sp. JKK-2023 TaxID=3108943 RepID=UPI002B05FE41|nr:hypothetical protein [Allobaculum sp. JKK-2023]